MQKSFVAAAILFLVTAFFIANASAFGPTGQGSENSESIRDPFPHKKKVKVDNKRIKNRTGVTITSGGTKATSKLLKSSSTGQVSKTPSGSGSSGVIGKVGDGPAPRISQD